MSNKCPLAPREPPANRFPSRSSAHDDGAASDHHASGYPSSPRHQSADGAGEFGPIPISPHVNVPNTQAFNHHVPPPLPPRRRERKESDAAHLAQIRQAPDAPQLPPRDISPPPLPPRLGLIHTTIKKSNTYNSCSEEGFHEHSLKLPHTSTIMMRRNSALERASKDGNGVASTSTGLQTSSSVDGAAAQENNPVKKFRQNVASAPPISRRAR